MRRDVNTGLAVAAVAALTVTGLTAAPAVAAGEAVVMVSLFNQGGDASLRFDGGDNEITLTAMRLDPTATVTFQYNTDPMAADAAAGWTAIAEAPTLTGDFARVTWAPDAALAGTSVAVRAVADVGGNLTYSTRRGVVIGPAATGPATVGFAGSFFPISSPAPTELGFFDQPYASTGRTATRVGVVGFTSATSGTVQVGWWRPSDQTFQGRVAAQIEPVAFKVPPSTTVQGGGFASDLDITAFDADAGDVIAVGAELETDDVLPLTLYAQQVATITASAQAPAGPGQPAPVTLTVTDSSAGVRPVVGAEVRRLSDGSLVGYTNARGAVQTTQFGGRTETYYVNTTDADPYDAAVDKSTGPFSPYAQSATTVQAVSVDGPAFDDDEYAAGDLRLQVLDQYAVPMGSGGTDVSYRLYPTGSTPPAVYATTPTDAQGRVTVPFAPAGPDGGYTLDFHLGSDPDTTYTFTAGDSTLALAPAAGASSPGGQIAYTATLSVAGKPLPGRRVQASYTRGIELVPGTKPDAGLLGGSALLASVAAVTNAQGVATFVVDDPAEKPQGAETGGKLALATLAANAGTVTGNPGESASGTSAFGSKKGKAKVKLRGTSTGSKDRLVVLGPESVAGEKVTLFRVVAGKLEKIKTKTLGKKGDTVLKVDDANGGAATTYLVKVVASDRVKASRSKQLPLE